MADCHRIGMYILAPKQPQPQNKTAKKNESTPTHQSFLGEDGEVDDILGWIWFHNYQVN